MTGPTPPVTFLLTEVVDADALRERHGAAAIDALRRQRDIVTKAAAERGAIRVKTGGEGETVLAVFDDPVAGIEAARDIQRTIANEAWTPALRVRAALHSGEAHLIDDDYYGVEVNRCARLRALASGGQTLISSATQTAAAGRLPPGVTMVSLGSHRLRDLTRPEQVFQLRDIAGAEEFPPLRSLDTLPTNLPVQLTSFVGREQELAEIRALLVSTRLVTLTGAGGVGKTRLALQLGAEVLDEYPDGVWFVSFAAVSDPAGCVNAVAATLGLKEEPGRALEDTIAAFLGTRTTLLVLDDCEHVVATAASVAGMALRGATSVRIVATSREPLGVPGEVSWRVPSLRTPDPNDPPPPDRLAEFPAARLFVDRARQVDPRFAITQENAASIALICHRLDGIALAIELAASRIKALTAPQIAARLDDRFKLLAGGSRASLERQRTLRALVDWSHELLTEHERLLLRRLSVFASSFTLAGAEAVSGDVLSPDDVLDLLGQLESKSLIVFEAGAGETRHRLQQTIRQYAVERLLDAGETDVARTRHRDHYLALAERAAPHLGGAGRRVWLDRLEADEDDLRAALEWSVGDRTPGDAALRLAAALARFWEVRGRWTEGRRWLREALESAPDADRALRARALRAAGTLAWHQADYAAADWLVYESLGIRRDLGDDAAVADSLAWLGWVRFGLDDYEEAEKHFLDAIAVGRSAGANTTVGLAFGGRGWNAMARDDYGTARTLLERALTHARQDGDEEAAALYLSGLGTVASARGEYDEARRFFEQALMHARALGDRAGIGLAYRGLGRTALASGDIEKARTDLAEALQIHRDMGGQYAAWSLGELAAAELAAGSVAEAEQLANEGIDLARRAGLRWPEAHTLHVRGCIHHARGRLREAVMSQREAIKVWDDVREQAGIAACLEELAAVFVERGKHADAARLFGVAEAVRETIGAVMPAYLRPGYERAVGEVRSKLDPERFAATWAEGRATTLAAAVASVV